MTQYEISWVGAPKIQPQDLGKSCKQVYVWIVTKDRYIVIVSKDGKKWQLPGGKPQAGETLPETAAREVREETALDISKMSDGLHFFGYKTVKDIGSAEPPYLQIRYLLELDTPAANVKLGAHNEDGTQPQEDAIRFVTAVDIDDLVRQIPWLAGSPEFTAVKSLVGK